MFSESRIGARASGLGSPARPLGALTRRALILRPPPRPESPPLSAQGHTAPSPPRESQATPSARRVTALSRGLWWRAGCGGSRADSDSCNRRAEGTLQSRRPAPKGPKHPSVTRNFCWSKWREVNGTREYIFWFVSAEILVWGKCSSCPGVSQIYPYRSSYWRASEGADKRVPTSVLST